MNLREIIGGINYDLQNFTHCPPPDGRLARVLDYYVGSHLCRFWTNFIGIGDRHYVGSPFRRFWIDFIDFGAILNTSLRGAKRRGNPLINKTHPNPPLKREGIYISCAKHTVTNLSTYRLNVLETYKTHHPTLSRICKFAFSSLTNSTLSQRERVKCAFTLTEVLITLGIIGIVAALVIPNAVSNYRKHIVETKLKQTYSILANAVSAAETEIGMPFGKWYMTTYHPDLVSPYIFFENGDALYQDFIKPYINKNVKEYNIGFFGAEYRGGPYFDNDSRKHFLTGKPFTLPNGCTAIIYNYQIYILTDPLSFNSKKKVKIQPGKNYFSFGPAIGTCSGHPCVDTIPHTFAPMVTCNLPSWWGESGKCRPKYTHEQMIENCANKSIIKCTQLLIENDFKFPKDYPVKF